MRTCKLCKEQSEKSSKGKPHENLIKMGEPRIYKGQNPRTYKEQDYQCLVCQSKFTHSTNKNDIGWTLWQG